MEGQHPRVLFLPVSDATGIGEYMRSVIIADEVKRLWPGAQMHFLLSQDAPYGKACPYPATLLQDSPTKAVAAVCSFMTDFKPDLVVFDASGRRSQLAHAKRLGAAVIFISQHARKRRRGMKLSRARLTDRHWVAQPDFAIPEVSAFSRFKLQLFGGATPVATGPFFARVDAERQQALLTQLGLTHGGFWLLNAGSGAHSLGGRAAMLQLVEAASQQFSETGIPALAVMGPAYKGEMPPLPGILYQASLTNHDFINLLAAARGAVLSGGDTLLQAIALKKPCVAVAVTKDQPARIARCEAKGLVMSSGADELASKMAMLNAECEALTLRLQQSDCGNGLDWVEAELSALLERK